MSPSSLFLAGLVFFEAPLLMGIGFRSGIGLPGIVLMVWGAWCCLRRGESLPLHFLASPAAFWGITVFLTFGWAFLYVVRFQAAEFSTYDTGVFAHLLETLRQTGVYRTTILGNHGLGDHFTPILFALEPFTALVPATVVLLSAKIIAFVATSYLLLRLSRLVLGEYSRLAYVVPLLFTGHALVFKTMQFEFQPSSLALPFIVAAFICAQTRRYSFMIIPLLLGALCKEHLTLVWGSLGLFIMLEHRYYWRGGFLMVTGVLAGLCLYLLVMPYFADGVLPPHAGRFGPLDLLGLKLKLLSVALLSVGLLPCLSPRTLLWLSPSFGIALVSREPQMLSFNFHYQDLALVVTHIAAIYGLKAYVDQEGWSVCLSEQTRRIAEVIIPAGLLIGHHLYPSRDILRLWPSPDRRAIVQEAMAQAKTHPASDPIWVIPSLGPYFSTVVNHHALCDSDALFQGAGPRTIAVAPGVNPYPLSAAEYERLMNQLERKIGRSGGGFSVERVPTGTGLKIYRLEPSHSATTNLPR